MKIALDYGHCLSGADTGARGNGYKEEECTRQIGRLVKAKLEAFGHSVLAVAPDSSNSVSESLNTRVSRINSFGANLSVSIHLNAGGGRGTEIYTDDGANTVEAVKALANIVALGYVNRGIKNGNGFALVAGPTMKAMLIECCFIDSAEDMARYNPEKLATAIANGINGTIIGVTPPTPPVTPPTPPKPTTPVGGKFINLSPAATKWNVYPTTKSPVIGNEVGTLAPSQFGGLSYQILGNPQKDVYTIQTKTFGVVNIYVPQGDSQASFTNTPLYGGAGGGTTPTPPPSNKRYLNLSPKVTSWRVYPTNKQPVVGNEVGFLAPSQFGGLSYEIFGNPSADVYTIKTSTFGTVNIYAPKDGDSSITSSPLY